MKDGIVLGRGSDTLHAMAWGLIAAGAIIAGIFFGSRGLRDFDPALVSYAGATVFAAFGLGYRYAMWLRRPPTRVYWFRGWQIFLAPKKLPTNLGHLARIFWNNIVLQRFIDRRSHTRWTAHWFLAWGCILAAAVTFPLSFGWVRFETARDSQEIYNAFMFGIPVGSFHLGTHRNPRLQRARHLRRDGADRRLLRLWRRGRDHGAMTVQQFSNDLLPLIFLFAISITGLFLTASTHLMNGLHYGFLSQLHAITVILTLLYLPFGKFFHIFQRPAQLGVDFYKQAGAEGTAGELYSLRGAVRIASSCRRPEGGTGRHYLFIINWRTAPTIKTFAHDAVARTLHLRKMVCGRRLAREGLRKWQSSP